MIHIIEEHIEPKADWGKIYTIDAVLPANVKRIKGVLVNIVPDSNCIIKTNAKIIKDWRLASGVKKYSPYLDSGEATGLQVGICNVSVNNTSIVCIIPSCVTKELTKSTYGFNKTDLQKPYEVSGGSTLRIVFEEAENEVFWSTLETERFINSAKNLVASLEKGGFEVETKNTLFEKIASLFHYEYKDNQFEVKEEADNGYTLKLYIDYD